MFRTHRAGKGPGNCGGWGLGSRNRRGPGMPPTLPWSQRAGDLTWEPVRLPGLECWSSPLLLLWSWMAPPTCLSWSPRPPSCAPRTHAAWRGLWREGVPAWELSTVPGPSGPGDYPPLLSCCSWRVTPACLSWSPWPQGRRSYLASTSPPPSVPPHPTCSLGGSSHFLGRQCPPPGAGRCPSCGETLTRHLPTLPSSLMIFY